MKVISFDIGIKNMAYCVLSNNTDTSSPIIVHDWNVISMIEETTTTMPLCTCIIPGKNKKADSKICNKKSKYAKNNQYFCERHAKTNKQFIIPTKKHSLPFIKKQKLSDLVSMCNAHMLLVNVDAKTHKKDKLMEILSSFYQQQCFETNVVDRTKNANEVDLIHIGRSIKRLFNQLPDIDTITHVLIENQISPIANRMKTIQGMLAQYFIMKNDDIYIHFVSSSHKLNQFKQLTSTKPQTPVLDVDKINPQYKVHKADGISYCSEILEMNPSLLEWKQTMNTRKSDDLADAFLQGLWYLKHQNIICYADDLKINLV